MKNKVVIIGGGHVGITILHTLMLNEKINLDIFLIDNNVNRAKGNIEDLNHCLIENHNVNIGTYEDLVDASVLIIAAGVKQENTRGKFLKKSYLMIKDIVDNINKVGFKGNIIVISNPNDVLTTYIAKNYYNPNLVIGTGTNLDTNRLRYYLSNIKGKENSIINDYVIGEHGLNQEVVWCDTNITEKQKEIISNKVKNIAYEIVSLKGYTNFAIAHCANDIVETILTGNEKELVASVFDKDIEIAYSMPIKIVNREVVRKKDAFNKDLLCNSLTNIKREYKIFENNKIIGIDLDDTITTMNNYMLEEAFKYDKEIGGKGIVYKDKYLIGEQFNWTDEQKDVFFKEYRIKAVEKARVRPYVKSVLRNLRDLGYKIIIITARSDKYYTDPFEYTKRWLLKKQIPFDKLIVNSKDKKEVCKEENINIFVDDMPKNCEKVNEIDGVLVYMMDNGNNISSCKKIKNFKELYERILENE